MIGNTNTKRIHDPGCRAVNMIAPEHRVDGADLGTFWKLCKWCKVGGTERSIRGYKKAMNFRQEEQSTFDEIPGILDCHDPTFQKLFRATGCLACNSKLGTIKMMQDDKGVEVKGQNGRWWVFFECENCGYQTAWWKAYQRLKVIK